MDALRITGGVPLRGSIAISGAKNAALPLMAASLLTDEGLNLGNLPDLADIDTMALLLRQLGVDIRDSGDRGTPAEPGGRAMVLDAAEIASTTAPYDLVRRMRASVLVLGPLLARFGHARVSLPGGCAIGPRPVDLHLRGLTRLGATIDLDNGYIDASAPNGLTGAEISFPAVSVGATENVLMAACLADGETVLDNAAREPEIVDLANCLLAMGADIEGIGTERLTVRGAKSLHHADYSVLPDRIETATYAMAAAATGGEVELVGARADLIGAVVEVLHEAGVVLKPTEHGLMALRNGGAITGVDTTTQPYPGFPTDLQAQLMALLATAEGASTVTETIFENRFMHVPELNRMGANIAVHGAFAVVRGVPRLRGAPVMATDIRASVSLVIAALVAEGQTTINRLYHLDRGYEKLVEKLAGCGARIERFRA